MTNNMTVKELMDILKNFDENMTVRLFDLAGGDNEAFLFIENGKDDIILMRD